MPTAEAEDGGAGAEPARRAGAKGAGKKARKERAVTRLADLAADPANCRKHDARNLVAISNSLKSVGAARSIVIDENDVVLAGNGVVQAAGAAGIEKVKIVEADGQTVIAVRRTGLTPRQKAQLAIADNRTAELADWDCEQLLKTIADNELDAADLEFTPEELEELAEGIPDEGEADAGASAGAGASTGAGEGERFMITLTCRDEAHQRELLERFEKEGIECRALIG